MSSLCWPRRTQWPQLRHTGWRFPYSGLWICLQKPALAASLQRGHPSQLLPPAIWEYSVSGRVRVVKAAGCAGQGILILAWLETRDHFNPFALRAFQSRLSRASMVKSCRRARGLNPFTLNSCPPHSSRSEASSSCRPRRTQWPLVLQTGWRLRYLWRRWVQLVHFCCEARFTHSVVAPEILDRYCQHDSPHQGGLSPPLAGG